MSTVWRVDDAAQRDFIELSGDRNPIHVDPLVARRLPFGRVAVHGAHIMLHALDTLAAATPRAPRRVRCSFRHTVGIDDEIATTVSELSDSAASIRVTTDVWTAADIGVELGDPHAFREVALGPLPERVPEVHDIDSLASASGRIAVTMLVEPAVRRFPRLAERIGVTALAELVSLTRLVGMHVPGQRSLLSGVDVSLGQGGTHVGSLDYSVDVADARFSRVVIRVEGPSIAGTVTAFVRPAPVRQQLGDVRPEEREFAGQRWLVVGGSRGLGELTVRLLAAGGADVRFTFHRGADDAAALARSSDGAVAYRLDVHQLDTGLSAIQADGWRPTHLAYMATPPIFEGTREGYSTALFERLKAVYVDRFTDLLELLGTDRPRRVLWPSSVAVEHDVAGMAEYADAKRAGEAACARLAAADAELRIEMPRFPRLLTDQTTSFVPVEFGDAAVEVLAALRRLTG
jgi:acyl dehydratase